MGHINNPDDRDFIRSQEPGMSEDSGVIPLDFEVVEQSINRSLPGLNDPDSMIDSIESLKNTYKTFGHQYGIEMKFDVEKVSDTFKSIISDKAEKVFALYLSKSYSKVRLAIFNKILVSVQTLVDRITTKEILETDNIEMSVTLLEKLFDLMDKVNKVYSEIHISSADLMLKATAKDLKSEAEGKGDSNLNNEEVEEALRLLRKNTMKK